MILTWTAELITSVCAVLVAICALLVSIWQGCLNRKHYRLSSMPFISVYKVSNGELKIKNSGTGLAILKEFTFIINETEFDGTDPEYWGKLHSILGAQLTGRVTAYYFTPGTRIESGRSFPLITWSANSDDGSDLLNEFTKNSKFSIVYSSMYGEDFYYGSA